MSVTYERKGIAVLIGILVAFGSSVSNPMRAFPGLLEGLGDALQTRALSSSREAELEKLIEERVQSALSNPPFKVYEHLVLPPELVNLIVMALEKNPQLKLARSQIAIYEQKVAPAGAKMDPMLGIEFMNRMVPRPFTYMMPDTMDTIRLRQEFMSYGKRITKRDIAQKEVELRKWEVAEAEYMLTGEIFNMYYDLLENAVQLDQIKKNRELLSALTDIIRARYELNQVMQSDLLMVQMRYSETYEREIMLEEMRKNMVAKLAGMVGVSVEELEFDLNLNGGELALPSDLTPVLQLAILRHPENSWLDTRASQVALMQKLAKKEYQPDYALELSYGYRQMFPDMFSLGIMFNLPVYKRQKQDAMFMEASAMAKEVEIMREMLFNEIRANTSEQFAKLGELKKRLEFFENVLLPQVRATFDSALASYQVNMNEFAVLIDAALALIDMETDYRIATVNYGRSLALIDYYTLGSIKEFLPSSPDATSAGQNSFSDPGEVAYRDDGRDYAGEANGTALPKEESISEGGTSYGARDERKSE